MFSLVPWRREKRGALARRENDPFTLMRREFDSLFDRFFGDFPLAREEWASPTWGMELEEQEKEIVVRAEAPGFECGDFDVRVTGDTLTITAEHKEEMEKGEKKEKNGSRSWSRLERMVALPPYADADKVEATYRNGVLELHFPKMAEAEGKKIEVKA